MRIINLSKKWIIFVSQCNKFIFFKSFLICNIDKVDQNDNFHFKILIQSKF